MKNNIVRAGVVLGALAGSAALIASFGFASAASTLFGNAAVTSSGNPGPGVELISDTSTSTAYGGMNFGDMNGQPLSSLTNLAADFNVTDTNCGGGSPRFEIAVSDGTHTGNIFVYLGPGPNFNTCPQNTWVSSGNLLDGSHTLDTSQLPGGTFYDSLSHALSAYGSYSITNVALVADGGWAAGGKQDVLIDNVQLNGTTYDFTPPPVTVTIDKFVDGQLATAAATSTGGVSFPMTASWSATNIGSGSGTYSLAPSGFNSPNPYEAVTASMSSGADYATNEVTGGSVVGASCAGGQPFVLTGYTTGDSLAAAEAAALSTSSPSLTGITSNEYVIVWNRHCLAAPTLLSPANGSSTTTAALTQATWSATTDPVGGITYVYQSSLASTTNPDGSFTSPAYTSNPLATTSIPTPNTPPGTYYWHVQATDANGNTSSWSATWSFTVTQAAPSTKLACTLTANQTTITRGQGVLLTWTTQNATQARLTEDTGSVNVALSGSTTVYPRGSRPYILSVWQRIPRQPGDFMQCRVQITVNQR